MHPNIYILFSSFVIRNLITCLFAECAGTWIWLGKSSPQYTMNTSSVLIIALFMQAWNSQAEEKLLENSPAPSWYQC